MSSTDLDPRFLKRNFFGNLLSLIDIWIVGRLELLLQNLQLHTVESSALASIFSRLDCYSSNSTRYRVMIAVKPFQAPTTRRDVGVVSHVGSREAGCHSGHHSGSICTIANRVICVSHSWLEVRAIHGSRYRGSCGWIVRQNSKAHHSPIVRGRCRWRSGCVRGKSCCRQCCRGEACDFSD